MVSRFSISWDRLKSSSVSVTLPLSIRLMSRTSLIRDKRWRLATVILERQSTTLSRSSIWVPAMAVMPMMAFIGVRIS